jgi:hypothetical protein
MQERTKVSKEIQSWIRKLLGEGGLAPPPSSSNSRASFNISQLQLITTHGQREAARAAILEGRFNTFGWALILATDNVR